MRRVVAIFFGVLFAVSMVHGKPDTASDDEIAERIIAESIASYPGPCACPFNTTRNGSSCGRKSAYSKPGGYSPVCYKDDLTTEDIAKYRQRTLKD